MSWPEMAGNVVGKLAQDPSVPSDDGASLGDVLHFVWDNGIALGGWSAAVAAAIFGYLQLREARKANAGGGAQVPDPKAVANEESALERVLRTRTLRVGCIIASPWFIWPRAGAGQPTGIYPTIFQKISERTNVLIVYRHIRNDEIYDVLDRREVDLVTQLLQTEERSRRGLFAALIHNVKIVAVVQRGQQKLKTTNDLKKSGVKCAVVQGEIGEAIARTQFEMTEANNRLCVLNTIDVPSVFYQVGGQGADVAITTGARWIELQKRDPQIAANLHPLVNPLLLVPAGCLLRAGENELKEWLEAETREARRDTRVRTIENRFIKEFSDAIEKT